MISRMLNEQQAAQMLGVAAGTLSVWRCTGRHNIPFFKVGRKVCYRQDDLEEWLRARMHTETVKPPLNWGEEK